MEKLNYPYHPPFFHIDESPHIEFLSAPDILLLLHYELKSYSLKSSSHPRELAAHKLSLQHLLHRNETLALHLKHILWCLHHYHPPEQQLGQRLLLLHWHF